MLNATAHRAIGLSSNNAYVSWRPCVLDINGCCPDSLRHCSRFPSSSASSLLFISQTAGPSVSLKTNLILFIFLFFFPLINKENKTHPPQCSSRTSSSSLLPASLSLRRRTNPKTTASKPSRLPSSRKPAWPARNPQRMVPSFAAMEVVQDGEFLQSHSSKKCRPRDQITDLATI